MEVYKALAANPGLLDLLRTSTPAPTSDDPQNELLNLIHKGSAESLSETVHSDRSDHSLESAMGKLCIDRDSPADQEDGVLLTQPDDTLWDASTEQLVQQSVVEATKQDPAIVEKPVVEATKQVPATVKKSVVEGTQVPTTVEKPAVDQATQAVQPNPEQGPPTPMAVDEKPVVEATQIPTTVEKARG